MSYWCLSDTKIGSDSVSERTHVFFQIVFDMAIRYYTGDIVNDGETVLCFGSNPEGRHGAGAARTAVTCFGAKYGKGEGLQGHSYAIPTKDLRVKENNGYRSIPRERIIESIRKMYQTATYYYSMKFCIAYRNTAKRSLNGYTGFEMMQMFIEAGPIPQNVFISEEWHDSGMFDNVDVSSAPWDRMTEFQTSYYANPLMSRSKQFLVRISNSVPDAFDDVEAWIHVIPDWHTIVAPYKSGMISRDEYERRYRSQLDSWKKSIIAELWRLTVRARGRNLVLLCYEKPGAFCHRHILAAWLRENGGGGLVEEMQNSPTPSLFGDED